PPPPPPPPGPPPRPPPPPPSPRPPRTPPPPRGGLVQKYWIFGLATIAMVTGCAIPGTPDARGPQMAILPAGIPCPQSDTGLTERFLDYITPGSPASGAPQPNAATSNPASHKTDPISLGFATGPPNADLYLSMAQMSDRAGNTGHARNMYGRTLSVDSSHREALLGLARLEDREGNLDVAIQIYRQAAAAHPRDAKLMNDLALCHARQGKLHLAAQVLENAIHVDPKKQLYRNNIAKVLLEMNYMDQAAAHLSAVHPPAVVQYNLGVLLHQRGRSGEAARFLTAAAQMDPQLGQAQTLFAQIDSRAAQAPSQMATSNEHGSGLMGGAVYPSTSATGRGYQAVPAQMAQAPVGTSPVALPMVR
ncbi:MAG: tetratricopeptide repeat protein, partial [Pirellulales bacterium]|nr:tetratricopeptide repeat protein [Pirellulales bacterium]